jgi:hypothetical protein
MTESIEPDGSKLVKQLNDFEQTLKSSLSQAELDMLNSVLESLAETSNEQGDVPLEVAKIIKKNVESLFRSKGM